MELNSAETGLKLQQFAQKMHQQHGYDTESDIEEGEKPVESKREWRIQYDSERRMQVRVNIIETMKVSIVPGNLMIQLQLLKAKKGNKILTD